MSQVSSLAALKMFVALTAPQTFISLRSPSLIWRDKRFEGGRLVVTDQQQLDAMLADPTYGSEYMVCPPVDETAITAGQEAIKAEQLEARNAELERENAELRQRLDAAATKTNDSAGVDEDSDSGETGGAAGQGGPARRRKQS